MVEWALSLAIASCIYNVILAVKIKKLEDTPLVKHIRGLSEETIEDIIKDAIPETNEGK